MVILLPSTKLVPDVPFALAVKVNGVSSHFNVITFELATTLPLFSNTKR